MKKKILIHLREKRIKQKIISTCSHPKFVLRFFLKNVKKTNCLKYTLLWGSCRKPISSYNFTDIIKLTILFHLQWLGAERHIPVLRISEKQKFLNHIFCIFFVCVACFYWNEIEYSKSGMWRSRQFSVLQRDVCFSLLGKKLWEEIHL